MSERGAGERWLMWEVRAATGQVEALLAWALREAPAAAQVYRSEDRVVVIAEAASGVLADPPKELLARPAHSWTFERVR
jgi:hypothetical protein